MPSRRPVVQKYELDLVGDTLQVSAKDRCELQSLLRFSLDPQGHAEG